MIISDLSVLGLVNIQIMKGRQFYMQPELSEITERINENPLQELINTAYPDKGACITDLNGYVLYVNIKFCEQLKYPIEYINEQDFNLLNHSINKIEHTQTIQRTIEQGIPWDGRISFSIDSRKKYTANCTISNIRSSENTNNLLFIFNTLFEDKKENRLQEILKQTNIGIWEWDIQKNQITHSENMAYFTNGKIFPLKDNKLNIEQCFSNIHKEDLNLVKSKFEECRVYGKNFKVEYRILWPDDSIHWVQVRGDIVKSDKGIPKVMSGVMFDISNRKQIESALQQSQLEAINANKSKSDFLLKMSHELLTPLNAIIGFSGLHIDDDNLGLDQTYSIKTIHEAGNYLHSIINDILDHAKIEAGKIQLQPISLPVVDLLNDSLNMIKIILAQNNQNLSLKMNNCENINITIDKKRFTQIFLNLLSNGIKYNKPKGQLVVECKQVTSNLLRISVADQGQGLNALELKQLFQPFHRIKAENTKVPGTGIGLVITKQLVDLMGCDIDVKSKPGTGTTFWIDIPIV